jgi:hypothetical protein
MSRPSPRYAGRRVIRALFHPVVISAPTHRSASGRTSPDYAVWEAYMRSRRGRWTVDSVHDGRTRDLIAFCGDPRDPTRGVYVSASGPTAWAGTYTGALPHIGDAEFRPLWGMTLLGPDRDDRHGIAPPAPAVREMVSTRLGI